MKITLLVMAGILSFCNLSAEDLSARFGLPKVNRCRAFKFKNPSDLRLLYLEGKNVFSVIVDWGDGSSEECWEMTQISHCIFDPEKSRSYFTGYHSYPRGKTYKTTIRVFGFKKGADGMPIEARKRTVRVRVA